MPAGPAHMEPGRLGWQQGLATWHKVGWDGNRVWPHGTRVAGMATGSDHMPPGRLRRQQVWPNGTREAGIVTGSGHMALG